MPMPLAAWRSMQLHPLPHSSNTNTLIHLPMIDAQNTVTKSYSQNKQQTQHAYLHVKCLHITSDQYIK